MANSQQSRAERGYVSLAEAIEAGIPADQLLKAAVCSFSDDGSPQQYVDDPVNTFVTEARAAAIAPVTPANRLDRYLSLASEPAPPLHITISVDSRDIDLFDDSRQLAELVEVFYHLQGWEGLRRIQAGIEQRKAELRAELEAKQEILKILKGAQPELKSAIQEAESAVQEAARSVPMQLALLDTIASRFQAQKDALVERFEALLERFEAEARADLRRLFDQTEATVWKERQRYGVRYLGGPQGTVTLEDHKESQGLRAELRRLAKLRRDSIEPLQKELLEASRIAPGVDFAISIQLWFDIVSGLGQNFSLVMGDPLFMELHRHETDTRWKLYAAQAEYAKLRAGLAAKYPVVHLIAERINEQSNAEDVAAAIYLHTERLRNNIQELRKEIAADRPSATRKQTLFTTDIDPAERVARHVVGGPMDIWELPNLITFTYQRMGFKPGDLGDVMVKRILAGIPIAQKKREKIWEIVGWGLMLLTFVFGPEIVILQGIISGMRAIDELAEYNQKIMLLHSEFEPTLTLLKEEPSALQLYQSLVFYGLDVFQAGKAILKLARPAARAAQIQALKRYI